MTIAAGRALAGPAAATPAQPAASKKVSLPETTEGMPWQSNHEIKKESNPFTDRDWRMWIYAWSGLLVRLAIILGGMFSVYQYLEISEEKRLTKTFELLAEWEKPDYQTAQIALRERLVGLNTRYSRPARRQSDADGTRRLSWTASGSPP